MRGRRWWYERKRGSERAVCVREYLYQRESVAGARVTTGAWESYAQSTIETR